MSFERPDSSSSLFVGSVGKAFRILEAFDSGQRTMPLVQIAAIAELDASAAQRAVYTLMALGYLRKDSRTRHYSLTPKILNLGTSYLRAEGLAARATPYIRQASDQAKEAISLLELDGTDVIHVIRYSAPGSINMRILIGSRTPAFAQAGGRAMLAFMPPEEAAVVLDAVKLEPLTRMTVTTREAFQDRLARVRAEGFCVVEQEHSIDEATVGAPVFSQDGRAIAAVSFQVPMSRWRLAKTRQRLTRLALDTASAISATDGRR